MHKVRRDVHVSLFDVETILVLYGPLQCPGLLEAWRLWSLSISVSDSYSYEVSSQPIKPLVDELVTVMQSSIDPTPLLGG
jgi:hypothetical protein